MLVVSFIYPNILPWKAVKNLSFIDSFTFLADLFRFSCAFLIKHVFNISPKLLRPSQFLKKFMEILEWSKNCAKKLSQILANNIDNGWRGEGLSKKINEK